MKKRAWVLAVGLALGLHPGLTMVWADQKLSAQQADAQKQRIDLQQRIHQLQKVIESTRSDKKDATSALRDVETRISATDRKLSELADRQQQVKSHMADLKKQITAQQQKQQQGQQQLAQQLRAQYASGLSPWTALLSGNDPQQIQRELGYLSYVSKAQANQVRVLQQGLQHLQQLHVAEKNNQTELNQLAQQTESQKAQLEKQQTERETVLANIEQQLKDQQHQAKVMVNNDARLSDLITGLEKEIARQAELRRQAELKRQAEEARRQAEEKRRQAEEARRLAQQKKQADAAKQLAAKQEAARQAEEERLYALAHTPALPAIEPDKEPVKVAIKPTEPVAPSPKPVVETVALAPVAPVPAPPPPPKAPKPVALTEPNAGFSGLKKGMTPPVRGQVQGRFGTERPEGGPWRGIILRAPAGTPVKAVADGRVVFSNWMAGFGNLLILDHGAGYLSVYGHNQSVLKQVGEVVAAGDAVARVGATGGQIEPGVYFEIRQNGQPINPQLWLVN